MNVRKAVIPAAGFDTGMLPITSMVPKELLPVCGRPVIEHVVKEAVEAGIEEVILVICKGKEAVADYFRVNNELKSRLLTDNNSEALEELERIWGLVKITTVYQDEQKGLGHAVLAAKAAIGNEPFAVLLGDSIVHTDECGSFTKDLITAFDKYGRSVMGVQQIERCLINRHDIFEGKAFDGNMFNGQRLIEKPTEEETESNLAFCARYVFKPDIFHYLEETEPDNRNKISLTEAMQKLLVADGLLGAKLEGDRFDIRDTKGLLLANLCMTELGCG